MAVPISIIIIGVGYLSNAATALATKSAPNWLCTSIRIFNPVLTPGPTIIGAFPSKRVNALVIIKLMGGTTLEKIAPVTSFKSYPYSAKRFIRSTLI